MVQDSKKSKQSARAKATSLTNRGVTAALKLKTLRLEQDERVVTAFYSSPPLNFVTTEFLQDLDLLTRVADRDLSVGAIVLTSDINDRFMIHVDVVELSEMVNLPLPTLPARMVLPFWKLANLLIGLPGGTAIVERMGRAGKGLLWAHRWKKTTLRMNRSGVVYLAAINGPALAGGNEIALACDLRYAADDPRVVFSQIEILFGMLPGGGGTQRLAHHIGTGRALELILEGSHLDVHKALEFGLIQRIVPADHLLKVTQQSAARLANRNRTAIASAKRMTYGAHARSLQKGLDYELASFIASGTTDIPKKALRQLIDDYNKYGETPFLSDPEPWLDGTRFTQE